MQTNTESSLNKPFSIIAFCIILAACQSTTTVPKGIIQLNAMKELMWDIAQVEGYATQHIANDSTKKLKDETLVLYQKVFALHKTTKENFVTSIKYYEVHPPKHKILLDSLLQYATRMKEKDQQTRYSKPVSVVN